MDLLLLCEQQRYPLTKNHSDNPNPVASRAQYTDEQKAAVSILYKLCRTPEDRDRVAADVGIGSRQKLYNLASRIDATRPHANSQQEITSDDGYNARLDTSRLFLRDDFTSVEWSEDDERYLREHFGRTFIEDVGVFLNRSETAVAYKARTMGLRNVPKYYDVAKVSKWLGLKLSELIMLTKHGLELFPCVNPEGKVEITLVSTTSLARVLVWKRLWKMLLAKHDADEFFIRDVIESIAELQKGDALWEPNPWVSHGHTCLNPFAGICFGLFYNGYDSKMDKTDELDPRDLAPWAKVTSDDWRRGAHGQDRSQEELTELAPSFREAVASEELVPA